VIVNSSRRCDFNGCIRPAKYEVCIRAWPGIECARGTELTFRFKKVCCVVHRLESGPVSGLLSDAMRTQINFGLLSEGKKARDWDTAKFMFEALEVINTQQPKGANA
jgi:hypothetical protein